MRYQREGDVSVIAANLDTALESEPMAGVSYRWHESSLFAVMHAKTPNVIRRSSSARVAKLERVLASWADRVSDLERENAFRLKRMKGMQTEINHLRWMIRTTP